MANPITSGVQPVQGPKYSGFDKSFKNLLTAKVGTLVPVLCDPVIPGTRVDLRASLKMAMPPLASDTFMNVQLKQEAFFVPASSLYGGFNDFITKRDIMPAAYGGTVKKAILPYIDIEFDTPGIQNGGSVGEFDPGTLADYLGFRSFGQLTADMDLLPKVNPFPFLAYHRVYDRFYRNSLITKPLFQRVSSKVDVPDGSGGTYKGYTVGQLPYLTFVEGEETAARIQSMPDIAPDPLDPSDPGTISGIRDLFSYADSENSIGAYASGREADDLIGLFHLRQRNFGADYFTTATPTPQRGDPSVVQFTVDAQGNGEISIAAIRAMNAMQLFRERNNYIDDNIHSYNRAHYNVNRTGYGESLPQFLGQMISNVYTDSVSQTAPDNADVSSNPFKSVGAEYGQASSQDSGNLVNGFEAPEFGYILVLASLVPEVAYSSGIERHLLELVNGNGAFDIPDALLQNVGPQEVFTYELDGSIIQMVSPSTPDLWREVFGYQQRFAHYMEKRDQVHGLFRDGESLEAFALQRNLYMPELSTEFLQIPCAYLDQVAAVSGDISKYGYWLDEYFDYKISMPIAAYSIPSLENPAGQIEWLPKPGYTLR